MSTKSFRKLTIASAVSLAMGFAGSAQAGAYALSYDNIFNLNVSNTPTGGSSTLTVTSTTNIVQTTAALSTAAPFTDIHVNPPGTLDALQAKVGAVTFGENNFTAQGPGLSSFSRGDAQIISTQFPAFPVGSTSTQAVNIAESFLAGPGTGAASGQNGSTTGFSVTFTVGGSGQILHFNADAAPFMRVLIQQGFAIPTSATANLSAVISITKAGTTGTVFNWAPDGVLGTGITGGTETADPGSLNTNIQLADVAGTLLYDPFGCGGPSGGGKPACGQHYAADTLLLTAGTYTLNLNVVESVNVLKNVNVPEPATLALMGLGLLGLGFIGRRKMI